MSNVPADGSLRIAGIGADAAGLGGLGSSADPPSASITTPSESRTWRTQTRASPALDRSASEAALVQPVRPRRVPATERVAHELPFRIRRCRERVQPCLVDQWMSAFPIPEQKAAASVAAGPLRRNLARILERRRRTCNRGRSSLFGPPGAGLVDPGLEGAAFRVGDARAASIESRLTWARSPDRLVRGSPIAGFNSSMGNSPTCPRRIAWRNIAKEGRVLKQDESPRAVVQAYR